jgi:hypothetical protein
LLLGVGVGVATRKCLLMHDPLPVRG